MRATAGRCCLAAAGTVLVALAVSPAAATDGPRLSVPGDRLASSLSCPARFAEGREPVLLVHGTATNAQALRWWPDIRNVVDDDVSLGGPHHGASGADQVCITGSCAPAAQQMRPRCTLPGRVERR